MKNNSNSFYGLFQAITIVTAELQSLLEEFLILTKEPETINPGLKNVAYVYMSQIINGVAKIGSLTGADKTGIKELRRFANQKQRNNIDNLLRKNKVLLSKIKNNRDRIIVHLDITNLKHYSKMKFSNLAVDAMINNLYRYYDSLGKPNDYNRNIIEQSYNSLRSASEEEERYSLPDFLVDIPKIKEIKDFINDLNFITLQVNQDIYDSEQN